jgi:hypothetical protein
MLRLLLKLLLLLMLAATAFFLPCCCCFCSSLDNGRCSTVQKADDRAGTFHFCNDDISNGQRQAADTIGGGRWRKRIRGRSFGMIKNIGEGAARLSAKNVESSTNHGMEKLVLVCMYWNRASH